jgi:hypothetical protein
MDFFEDEECESRRGGGFACMELRECVSSNCVQMFRGQAWRSPGLSILPVQSLKSVPVRPDGLRIEAENRPDFVMGRD